MNLNMEFKCYCRKCRKDRSKNLMYKIVDVEFISGKGYRNVGLCLYCFVGPQETRPAEEEKAELFEEWLLNSLSKSKKRKERAEKAKQKLVEMLGLKDLLK